MLLQVKLGSANSSFEYATHAHTQTKHGWLKAGGQLHNALFSVASSTEIEREEGAQLQVIFNPYVEQLRTSKCHIIKKGLDKKQLVIVKWPHYVPQGLEADTLTCMTET